MAERKPPTAETPAEPLSFEDAYGRLRATVEQLEAGNLPLEEATRLFEEGMRLAKACNELLSAAELRISKLQRSFGEQMSMMGGQPAAKPDDDEAEGDG
jgi:exodeoxyribonuclease VII small subunit